MVGPYVEELESTLQPLTGAEVARLHTSCDGDGRRRTLYGIMRERNADALVAGKGLLWPEWRSYDLVVGQIAENGQIVGPQPCELERCLGRVLQHISVGT